MNDLRFEIKETFDREVKSNFSNVLGILGTFISTRVVTIINHSPPTSLTQALDPDSDDELDGQTSLSHTDM